MDDDVRGRVLGTVEENSLIRRGDKLVVAVSGGADSVAILTILLGIREDLDLDLTVAHFNHCLRGASSDGDAAFVSSLAANHGLPFRSRQADVGREAALRGSSIEETARDMRYKFFIGLAGEVGAGKIALGHTADDLAETFLMRLLRGSGLVGLVPMEPMMERDGVSIIRPLLEVSHARIIRYLKANSIPYRLDLSNFSSSYFRNRIRLELIPELEAGYNSSIRDVLLRTSRGLSVVKDYIDEEVARVYGSCVEAKGEVIYLHLNGLHPAIASGVVRSALRSCGAPYSWDKIDGIISIARSGRGKLDLGYSVRAVAEKGSVVLHKVGGKEDDRLSVALAVPGRTVGMQVVVETSFVKKPCIKEDARTLAESWMRACDGERTSFEAYLDYCTLKKPLMLRARLSGDRFQPTGMSGTRKLKEIFIDEKVPERIRDSIPILVSGEDLVWVVGYRVGERFKVRADSTEILRIKVTVEE